MGLRKFLGGVLIFIFGFVYGLFGIDLAKFKVFDEIYFIEGSLNYLENKEFFFGHPPLSLLIFSLFLKLAGWPGQENYFLPRIIFLFLTSFFGVLIYLIILSRSNDFYWAFLGGFLANIETSLAFFRKFLLIEIPWLMFSLLAILFLKRNPILFFIFSGLAFSSKWFSIFFILPFAIFEKNLKIKDLIFGLIVVFLIYFLTFELHYLASLKKTNLLEVTLRFFKDNLKIVFSHSSQSPVSFPLATCFLGWPFGIKQIGVKDGFYIFPNIFLWWGVLISITFSFIKFKDYYKDLGIFIFSYLSYFLAITLIEYLRPGWLYFYFGALVYGIFILSYFLKKRPLFLILIVLMSAFLLPVSSGFQFFNFEKEILEVITKFLTYGDYLARSIGIFLGFSWF